MNPLNKNIIAFPEKRDETGDFGAEIGIGDFISFAVCSDYDYVFAVCVSD